MTDHVLKAAPHWYVDYANGLKTWSIRENDRRFRAGDYVILAEWVDPLCADPEYGWTGRAVACEVLGVFTTDFVPQGYVVLSLGPPGEPAPEYLDGLGVFRGPPMWLRGDAP